MIDLRDEAPLNRIFSRGIINNRDAMMMRNEGFAKSMMFDRLTKQLAACVLNDGGLVVTRGAFETTYEVDLLVLTSAQLEKYVQRRAERLGSWPYMRFVEDDTINPKGQTMSDAVARKERVYLSPADRQRVRDMARTRLFTRQDLATMFKVSESNISMIVGEPDVQATDKPRIITMKWRPSAACPTVPNRQYYCFTHDTFAARGDTPAQAYLRWVAVNKQE